MLSLVLNNLIVEVVDVVEYLISEDGRGPCFQLEHNIIPLGVCPLAIDLRPQKQIPRPHVPEIVLFVVYQVFLMLSSFLRLGLHFLARFVSARV
jgi:hypothetical protein